MLSKNRGGEKNNQTIRDIKNLALGNFGMFPDSYRRGEILKVTRMRDRYCTFLPSSCLFGYIKNGFMAKMKIVFFKDILFILNPNFIELNF